MSEDLVERRTPTPTPDDIAWAEKILEYDMEMFPGEKHMGLRARIAIALTEAREKAYQARFAEANFARLLAAQWEELTRAALAAMPGWQPIENSPAGFYLLTCREGEKRPNICIRSEDWTWFDREGRSTVTHSAFLPPTHYMPLPVPPAARDHSQS